jgi:hypothetical protein
MCQRELAEKKEEEERDYLFNHLRPMTKPKQMWREKWLAKMEGSSNDDSSGEEVSKVTVDRGKDNPGSGDGNPKSANCNPESGNCNQNRKTATWTRVTTTQVRRMTSKEM